MDRILVVFDSKDVRKQISDMLEKSGIEVSYRCKSGGEAIRAVKNLGGGIVICGFKLSDMTASDLAYDLDDFAVVLVIGTPVQLGMCENESVFKLPIPVSSVELGASVRLLSQMEEKKFRAHVPRRNADEEQLITKAKQYLMENNFMTEAQAHRFIQQKSMDNGTKMTETARYILSAFGR